MTSTSLEQGRAMKENKPIKALEETQEWSCEEAIFQYIGGKAQRCPIVDVILQHLVIAFSLMSRQQIEQCIQMQNSFKKQNIPCSFFHAIQRLQILPMSVINNLFLLKEPLGTSSLIPGYELTGLLGEGGKSAVYLLKIAAFLNKAECNA
jgi:hypothetical protein